MFNLSENYYLRKCYLKREQIPTQTVIKNKMSPPLAEVYFKSMSLKLKVMAGLEPPMKGGGKDWFIPPQDLLKGRTVMKPFKKKYLVQLSWNGIDEIGMKLIEIHRERMKKLSQCKLQENDLAWRYRAEDICDQVWRQRSVMEAEANRYYIKKEFAQFSLLYTTSIAQIQNLLFEAAINKIKAFREKMFQKMQTKYSLFLQQQATMLYDRYTEKLMKEKMRLKTNFIRNIETCRTALGGKLHDINLEKHVVLEKLRKLLECQNLACQVYVALKEREECLKEITLSKYEHTKMTKKLTTKLMSKDFDIYLERQKEVKRHEFIRMWEKKVCHVVKNFQVFVSYCLKMLPEYADFFINMEKLLLLQLNEALEDPSIESIIITDEEQFHTPQPRPHPFYLFCDKKYQTKVNQDLCPKHCTSSASQMPVIVINKRFIYAACDNFEQFTDKIKDYIHDNIDYRAEFEDHHNYSFDVPVKYTFSNQLLELKLESSLQQILQQEIENVRGVNVVCSGCEIPYCFYCDQVSSASTQMSQNQLTPQIILSKPSTVPTIPSGIKIARHEELKHEREPKWDNYMKYLKPKKCECAKMTQKHLLEHLPAYMRKMSHYDAPELLNYVPCSVTTLKALVKKAKGKKDAISSPPIAPPKTKEIATQFSDQEFEYLCTCFSKDFNNIHDFFKRASSPGDQFRVVDGSVSQTHLTQDSKSFASGRISSLRNLIEQSSEVKEIFMKKDCAFP